MRHKKAGVKLNRTTSHRQAMFRNMVTSLLKHDRIRTTDVKAKELRRWADHIITLAKRGDLHARRQVLAILREKDVAHKLFAEAQERFGNLNGGYTRIVKIGLRAGDAAPLSLIELVAPKDAAPKSKKSVKKDKKKTTEPTTATAVDKSAASAGPVEGTPASAVDKETPESIPSQESRDVASADVQATVNGSDASVAPSLEQPGDVAGEPTELEDAASPEPKKE